MSTELAKVKTKTRDWKDKDNFIDIESYITSTAFAGHAGRTLQINVHGVKNAFGGEWIHLSLDKAIEFRKVLTSFIESDYK